MTAPATHACTACGKQQPLDRFVKWRTADTRATWYCDDCQARLRTEATRRYRSDAAKAAIDRQRSWEWKERNRERNRARDRAYRQRKRTEEAA